MIGDTLSIVPDNWDENTEYQKRLTKIKLWKLLIDAGFQWQSSGLSVDVIPQNLPSLAEAESIFVNDDAFLAACKQDPGVNWTNNNACLFYCFGKWCLAKTPHERLLWHEKAQLHAINTRSYLEQSGLDRKDKLVHCLFMDAVIRKLKRQINPQ